MDDVVEILNHLEKEDTSSNLDPLAKLYQHTRTLGTELAPLFTQRGLKILSRHAFGAVSAAEYRSALKCLNNVLVRSPPMRQVFVDDGYPKEVLSLMKREAGDSDIELAGSNILIFCSAGANLNLVPLFEQEQLAEIINQNVLRHAVEPIAELTGDPTSPVLASLKLISTLSNVCDAHAYRFLDSIEPILKLLSKASIPATPLQPPISVVLACLASCPIERCQSFPDSAVAKLTDIFRVALPLQGQQEMGGMFMVLMTALFRLAQAPSPDTRSRLKNTLLPSNEDRAVPLGNGDSLPHQFLRLAQKSVDPELREMIFTLYFELSDKEPTRFVHNVGFGNAAGFLATKGIELTPSTANAQDSEGAAFNPVTGQRRDLEPQPSQPEMTDEEKEREAERLFVLFERLRQTGIMTVENPVAQAVSSGRFEELPDGADDADADDKTGHS